MSDFRTTLHHIPELDGLRGIAILMVLAVHTLGDLHLPGVAAVMLRSGWIGVDLFFVLSGFLITRILLNLKGRPAYYTTFYNRRILRIWPLYFSLLLFAFTVATWNRGALYFDTDKYRWYYYAAFVQNLVFPNEFGPTLLTITWSLAIEEQFYLVWPLAVASLSPARLKQLALIVLISQPVVRFVLLAQGAWPLEIYIASYCRCDGLACGAWIALQTMSQALHHPAPAAPQLAATAFAKRVIRWGLLAVTFAALLQVNGDAVVGVSPKAGSAVIAHTLVFSLLAMVFGICLSDVLEGRWKRWLRLAPLQYCGKISYSLYLTHWTIVVLHMLTVYPWIDRVVGRGLPAMIFKGGSVFAAIFLVSHLTWRFIEYPFQMLKSRSHPERLPSRLVMSLDSPGSRNLSVRDDAEHFA